MGFEKVWFLSRLSAVREITTKTGIAMFTAHRACSGRRN